MKNSLVYHVTEMLRLAKETIKGPALHEETGKINVKGDRTIGMDVKIEEVLIKYIKSNNLPVKIFSEETGVVTFHPSPRFLVALDPLDGSTNYKIGNNLLPFGTLIAFYENIEPRLNQVTAAGAIEYTEGLLWIYDGQRTLDAENNPVTLKTDWPIHQSTPVYLDLYYKEGYEMYRPLPQKIFVRNTGSTIGHLSYVLTNVAAGLGGVCMRAEEIGAVYSLIKGAGGIAVDHEGNDLGVRRFHPEDTYPMLAGSKKVVEFCVSKLNES